MEVSNKENSQVKLLKQLSADGRIRRKQGLFACEGARLCADAALSGVTIKTVLYTARAAQTYAQALQPVLQAADTQLCITADLAKHIADTNSPQGIFCICEMPTTKVGLETLSLNGKYLALEDIQDPSNLGTIIRTAEALGLAGLLLSAGCCDVYNPKVLRGSMGGVFRLPIAYADDMPTAITSLRQCGFTTYACVPDADAKDIRTVDLGCGTISCIGNEGNGLKPETVAACDGKLTIVMQGRAESLNAATAASIVMWEMKRQVE